MTGTAYQFLLLTICSIYVLHVPRLPLDQLSMHSINFQVGPADPELLVACSPN